ncbi:hypothetical protein D3C81_1975360 [compost metagenome]
MLLCGVTQLSGGASGDQGGRREVADGVGGQVAVSHHGAWLGNLPGFDNFAAQLTGSRVVAQNARIDMQQFHVESPGRNRRWRRNGDNPTQETNG